MCSLSECGSFKLPLSLCQAFNVGGAHDANFLLMNIAGLMKSKHHAEMITLCMKKRHPQFIGGIRLTIYHFWRLMLMGIANMRLSPI